MIDEDPVEAEPLEDYEAAQAAATPQAYRKQADKSKRVKDKAAEFWKRCMADPVGRAQIWDLLVLAGTFEERFGVGPNGFPQPEATWFNAGQKAFGQKFYQMLARVDRAALFLMHDEFDAEFQKPRPVKRSRSEDEF